MSVDNLTPHDLDQLSRLIVDALQVVDHDQGQNRGLARVRPGPRDLGGQLTDDEEDEGGENEEEERLQENPAVTPADRQGDFLPSQFIHSSVTVIQPRKESKLQLERPSAQTDEAQRRARQTFIGLF